VVCQMPGETVHAVGLVVTHATGNERNGNIRGTCQESNTMGRMRATKGRALTSRPATAAEASLSGTHAPGSREARVVCVA
jgi:hypothetical protein